MPRKTPPTDTEGNVIHIASNALKPADIQAFVDRYEFIQRDIDYVMQRAKENSLPFKEDQKQVVKEATECGLNKKAFKAILSKRKKLRAAEAVAAKLEGADKSSFESIEAALGPFISTPLGEAAARS